MDKTQIKKVAYIFLILFLVFTPILGFWIVVVSNPLFQSFLGTFHPHDPMIQHHYLFKNANLPTKRSFWLLVTLGSALYFVSFVFILIPWCIFPKIIKKLHSQNLSTKKTEWKFSAFVLTAIFCVFTGLILIGIAEYRYGYYSLFIKNLRSYQNDTALNNFLNHYSFDYNFKGFINNIYKLLLNSPHKFLWVTPAFVFMLTGFQIFVAIFCLVRISYRFIQILIFGESFNKTKGFFFGNQEKHLRYFRLRWKDLFSPSYKTVSFWLMALILGLMVLNFVFNFNLFYPTAVGKRFINYSFLYDNTFPPAGINTIYLDHVPLSIKNGYFMITQLPVISVFCLLTMFFIYFFMGWKKIDLTKNYFLSFLVVSSLVCCFDILSYGLAGGILNKTLKQWNQINALAPFNLQHFNAKSVPNIWLKTDLFVASVVLIGVLAAVVHFIITYTVLRHGPEMQTLRNQQTTKIKEKKINKMN